MDRIKSKAGKMFEVVYMVLAIAYLLFLSDGLLGCTVSMFCAKCCTTGIWLIHGFISANLS